MTELGYSIDIHLVNTQAQFPGLMYSPNQSTELLFKFKNTEIQAPISEQFSTGTLGD